MITTNQPTPAQTQPQKSKLVEVIKNSIREHSEGHRMENGKGEVLWHVKYPVNVSQIANAVGSTQQETLPSRQDIVGCVPLSVPPSVARDIADNVLALLTEMGA